MIYTAVIISENLQLFKNLELLLKDMNFDVIYQTEPPHSIDKILKFSPQIIILENQIEDATGLAFCNDIRSVFSDLLILLSDKTDKPYQEFTLNMGADASLSWQLGESLINANILALTRRFTTKTATLKLQFGDLLIDKSRRDAFINSEPLKLSTMEFKTIWFLACFPGEVVSRNRIHRGLYGQPYNGFDRTIDLYVSRIRQKIGDSPNMANYLKTVRGAGYQFIPASHANTHRIDTN